MRSVVLVFCISKLKQVNKKLIMNILNAVFKWWFIYQKWSQKSKQSTGRLMGASSSWFLRFLLVSSAPPCSSSSAVCGSGIKGAYPPGLKGRVSEREKITPLWFFVLVLSFCPCPQEESRCGFTSVPVSWSSFTQSCMRFSAGSELQEQVTCRSSLRPLHH